MFFPKFSPSSKVWVYTSNRTLSSEEQDWAITELEKFMNTWAAHGSQLFGDSMIYKDRFVLIAVDEDMSLASGCSIDSSVNFMKQLGAALNVDFFDRLNLLIEKNEEMKSVHLSTLKDFHDWKVYNPMITNLKDLREHWLIPVSASPFI